MPVNADFQLYKYEDGTLVVALENPEPIGGWSVRFQLCKRQADLGGVSGLVLKSMAAGFYGVSGMTIVNSGAGELSVALYSQDFSGLDAGNYPYQIARTDSGQRTILTEGYLTLKE